MHRPQVLAFDVNETLLDIAPLVAGVEKLIGAPGREWFLKTLHASLVANEIGAYRPFDAIGVEALMSLGQMRGLTVGEDSAREAVSVMTRLPPRPGVYNALERLFDAGLTMIALTNGSTDMANAQIEGAGLHIFMQRVISVEEVGLFKPASEVYVHAAKTMVTPIQEMMMIAAHDWDCAGALAAGARAALVRPGVTWRGSPAPELIVADMPALTTALLG